VAEAVAEDVGAAVVAVLATEATEAREAEAAARRLWGMLESIMIKLGKGLAYGSAAVQYWMTWLSTGGFSLLLGQLL
jgi:hypothetical protein